jgi:hypothetical protein
MLCLFLLAGFVTVLIIKGRKANLVSAQATKNQKEERRPKSDNNYLFSEPPPLGNWLFQAADIDTDQTHDPTLPVVIAAIRSYVGKDNWRKHLMIESIVLKNRTDKAIRDYRLGLGHH